MHSERVSVWPHPDSAMWSRVPVAVVVAGLMGYGGYRKRSLCFSGAVTAFLVGVLTFTASLRFGIVLIAFFVSSSWLTKWKSRRKQRIEHDHKPGGQRDWIQVLANSLSADVVCVIFLWHQWHDNAVASAVSSWHVAATCGFLGHYACCTGDTWASELGVLALGQPRLITTWRRVPVGTNGGVSLLGTAASVAGGAFLGIVYVGTSVLGSSPMHSTTEALHMLVLCTAASTFGSIVDSLLGATLQYSGFDETTRKVVSDPKLGAKHICGVAFMDNHQVNLTAAIVTSLATACVGVYVL